MNYSEARALMDRARYPANGKPLASNARLYERTRADHDKPFYAVRLYSTDIVTIFPDGTYLLNTGGWETTQTRDGIETYAPVPWNRFIKLDGQYWLRTRPNDNDPEPKCEPRQVPHPFWATSPGPEPVKGSFDCLAGTTVAYSKRVHEALSTDIDTRWNRLEPGDWPDGHSRAPAEHGSGRDVAAFLKKNERRVHVTRLKVTVTRYSEHYEQGTTRCPHCTKFEQRAYAWRSLNRAWEGFVKHMSEHGGQAGWLEAARADLRRVKAENKAWVEWDKRNRIPLNGTRVGKDGYPLKMEVNAYFSEIRRRERARRRREREIEAAARHQRHLARLKSGYMQRREARQPKFVRIANQIREDLEQTHLVLATGAWREEGDE